MKIEGVFDNLKKANQAVERLKTEGFKNAVVDINDHFVGDDLDMKTNMPGTETTPSLSGLILGAGDTTTDKTESPIAAVNPMVSGMAGFEEIADYNCKVVVDVNSDNIEQAKKIIADEEGLIEVEPDKIPKRMEDIDI